MDLLIIAPILFPLLGVLINAALGKRMSERAIGWVSSLVVVAAFLVSLMLFAQLSSLPTEGEKDGPRLVARVLPWIAVGGLDVAWGFVVDPLSVTLMLIITGIGALIHIYSIGYMHGDERFQRYFVYLNLFVASMLVLVMADNFLVMFVGWELVGLCSYLLIGFWFKNIKNAEAGRKAFVVNRIGDVGFVLGLLLTFVTFGTFNFDRIFGWGEFAGQPGSIAALGAVGVPVLTTITLLLFIGATGKSAQIPLFVWLPDAMAGPTPVSALIHAATMVTAGIYMMARAHAMFALAPATQAIVAIVGGLTAIVAGTSALRQMDIKKVLAYSTVSQLGFMVAAAGLGAYVASQFHLITHAFFKALLFLAAGSVIHGMEHLAHSHHAAQHTDPQDMRNMGGLRTKMPITFAAFLIGGLALAGIPPLSGFFSKDEIILAAWKHNPPVFVLLGLTAVFTAFYVGRQLKLVFFDRPRTPAAEHAAESPAVMTLPLIVLAIGAVIAGTINLPGGDGGWLHHWLEPALGKEAVEPFNIAIAGVFTLLSVLGLAAAWVVYRDPARATHEAESGVGRFLHRAWRLDDMYAAAVVKPFYAISTVCAQVLDVGVIDGVVNGIGRLFRTAADSLRQIQTGFVRNYGLIMLVGVVAVVAYFVLSAR